jgi:hypothetical protein
MACWLPAVESLDSLFLVDIVCRTEKVGFLFGIMETTELLRLELDDNLDHIHGLNHTGSQHAREPADPEGLDKVDDFLGGGFFSNDRV